eukprot:2156472-Rhodomonas_salina.6
MMQATSSHSCGLCKTVQSLKGAPAPADSAAVFQQGGPGRESFIDLHPVLGIDRRHASMRCAESSETGTPLLFTRKKITMSAQVAEVESDPALAGPSSAPRTMGSADTEDAKDVRPRLLLTSSPLSRFAPQGDDAPLDDEPAFLRAGR